ncbi:YdcF family protein [Edaphobacter aggregans]|uniref:YdcF family protein n=1 Tax=Edaphobacter aggregans TaxID=570835 RepID=UPI001FDF9E4B|nr:YdcF family protein [Edaphobacter aggregans]
MLALLLGGGAWVVYVAQQISEVADHDEAQQADAIAVFGAAEYRGRPSPTFHFRLDHAVDLYRRQIAPIVITLGGGSDKDSGNTEGAVGRDYLLANGIPFGNIIAETHSMDTEQQVQRLAAIAREYNLRHIVVVSDGTHLFRIRELCRDAGLDVYTSPRATVGHLSSYDLVMRYIHEIVSYAASKLHLDIGWPRRWLAGEEDI